jgi:hypothetical protein
MWANVLFVAMSGVLLVYWFRYTCLLILSTRAIRDYAAAVAEANALKFPEIQQELAGGLAEAEHMDALHRQLDRDYRLLTCLMRHGAEFRMAGRKLEHRMLVLDFHLMRAWYALTSRMSSRHSRQALEEMVHIVRHFADTMGECAATAQ